MAVQEPAAPDLGGGDPGELVPVHLIENPVVDDAGAVDHSLEGPSMPTDLVQEPLHVGLDPHVGLHDMDVGPARPQGLDDVARPALGRPPSGQHQGTHAVLVHHPAGHPEPQHAEPAGDQVGGVSPESHRCAPSRVAQTTGEPRHEALVSSEADLAFSIRVQQCPFQGLRILPREWPRRGRQIDQAPPHRGILQPHRAPESPQRAPAPARRARPRCSPRIERCA